jgi:hypothetical protein
MTKITENRVMRRIVPNEMHHKTSPKVEFGFLLIMASAVIPVTTASKQAK